VELLVNLGEQDEEIQRIVTAAMENRGVQGVVLDIDPYWLTWWNYTRRFGVREFERIPERSQFRFFRRGLVDVLPENAFPVLPLRRKDLDDRPSDWASYARESGFDPDKSPVRVTICLRPGGAEAPRLESNSYEILYETRPIAVLSAGPKAYRRPLVGGLSAGVGAGVCGTMGGIVEDRQDPLQKYGVTCAHVMTSGTVTQPAKIDSRKAKSIGAVGAHSSLQLAAGVCTPVSSTGLNTVDLALIKIDAFTSANLEILDIGPLTGVTPIAAIGQGQLVEFTGRSSGNRSLRIGGLGVLYKLRWKGQDYCFKNTIQLNWPRFYQLIAGRPVARGDSGAWICNPNENGFGWCGMIIGEDRLHGYALYAETLEDWWEQQGFSMTVT